jgi:hypothetical protein
MYNFKTKKGMKFSKLTHISIIVVLAIVFVVVYLYYTISDVKKIHKEVCKLTDDITKMNQSISNITSALMPMLITPAQRNENEVGSAANNESMQQCVYVTPNGQEEKVCKMPSQMVGVADDDSSVNSQELKTIMETIEDDIEERRETPAAKPQYNVYENDVANLDDIKDIEEMMNNEQQTLRDASRTLDITSAIELEEHVPDVSSLVESTEDLTALSVEELKKVSYNVVRKFCKSNGISDKGSKDVLIYRIKSITA